MIYQNQRYKYWLVDDKLFKGINLVVVVKKSTKLTNLAAMKKIKTAIVSYHNTYPFLLGLEGTSIADQIELIKVAPALCSENFINGTADIALVPVGALENLPEHEVFSDYCIGADGPVYTVTLMANSRMDDWTTVYLDTDSQTSVKLAKFILNEKNINVRYIKGLPDMTYLPKDAAVLMIGDKVFENESAFMHKYDLAEMWKEMLGLPFVFAVWVKKNHVSAAFCKAFNESLAFGVSNISTLKNKKLSTKLDLLTYLQDHISFHLDHSKKMAMELFLQRTNDKILVS